MRPLEGKVAVVAGATRGAGRGIACVLGRLEQRSTVPGVARGEIPLIVAACRS